MDFNKLKAPFPPELISWRVGATSGDKSKAIALAYIDARDVMERLDEVCGPENWQNKYPHANGKTSCAIGIKINNEWVWKENGAGDSQVEAEKGAFSDALKRAAVQWGIGRYLYDVANIWVEIEPYGKSYKIKNPNDPKLKKALETAAKGIRGASEPEPETLPLSEEELRELRASLNKSTTPAHLEAVKRNLSSSKPRMKANELSEFAAALKAKEAQIGLVQ
jgi:hypothetical protein